MTSPSNPPDQINIPAGAIPVYIVTGPTVTVAQLPAAAANPGTTRMVSDSTTVLAGNYGNAVVGGGANNVPVYSDGTTWRLG